MNILENSQLIIVGVGCFLGAFKASIEFDKDKDCLHKAINTLLGVFTGAALALHFGTHHGAWLNGLVALIGGASGAMVIDTLLQMLPMLTRKYIKEWVNKRLGKP